MISITWRIGSENIDAGCQFEAEVKCSNDCGKMIQQRYLASRVKTECTRHEVDCQYCHDIGEHQFIEPGPTQGGLSQALRAIPYLSKYTCEVGSVPQ